MAGTKSLLHEVGGCGGSAGRGPRLSLLRFGSFLLPYLPLCPALLAAPAAAQSSAGWTIDAFAGNGQTAGDLGDGGPATEALLGTPYGVATDAAGNVFIAADNRIRKVDAAGIVTTIAGTGQFGYDGDGRPATEARLGSPEGVAVDAAGNVFIADTSNRRIRRVDVLGIITTFAGVGLPERSSFDRGDGGPATEAEFNLPADVAVDGAGGLLIADTHNKRIRRVDAAGIITTIAGTGEFGYGGDGGPATEVLLNFPAGVTPDAAGNLYIADTNNHRIRKVDAAGVITTIAGNGQQGFDGDGGPATEARLFFPSGVAADRAGNIYVADTFNQRIRILTPPGNAPSISAGGVALANGTPIVERISPNALISVFGQDFAPEGAQARAPGLDVEGRVAANLAGVCLEIGGKRAPLFAVLPNQINAQVPHDLPPGQAAVEVIRGCGRRGEQRSAAETVAVAAVSPAFFNFTSNSDGRNPVAALHGGGPALAGSSELGEEFTPAKPGEIVSLFGTGFGETEPRLEAGRIPGGQAALASEVSFAFGGMAVPPGDVFYAGAAPCCAGLYQFTVRLPPDLPDGDAPVTATVQGVSTPEGPFLSVRRR